ncbi:MAG: sulfatase-like hydrolase/transferase [Chloroflexota bacterium]
MKTKPNILWIYSDELRTDALGCYGNPYTDISTPHIDSLAESGILFENCFCNSPVCVASRASILTGLYPEATGVYHNEAVWPNYRFDDSLTAPVQTFPALFAKQGYNVANFGKVHVPKALQPWGYSDTSGSAMPDFYKDIDRETLNIIRPPGIPTAIGGVYPADRPFPSDILATNAIEWMQSAISNGDAPFFVRASYLQPHTPVFPQPTYDQRYLDAPWPRTIAADGELSQFERSFVDNARGHEMSEEDIFLANAYYYGLVAWMDDQIGRLLDFLRERGQLDNTIVIFEADHGVSIGDYGRFQKQTYAPESHRVPRIISWAGEMAGGSIAGTRRSDINEGLDLARTLCTMVDIEPLSQFRGRDLFNDPAPEAVYSTIGYGFETSRIYPNLGVGVYKDSDGTEHGWPRRSCVRTEQHRLDKNVRVDGERTDASNEDVFLADVQADPVEKQNLAHDPAYADVVTQLSDMLDAHVAESIEVPEAWTWRDRTNQFVRA